MNFKWFFVCLVFHVILSEIYSEAVELNYRLPNNTIPETYDITLVTNVHKNDFNFSGTVIIGIRVLETTYNITLHARKMTIKTIILKANKGPTIQLYTFTHDNDTDFLTIPSPILLQKNSTCMLYIDYVSELRTDKNGFYRSSYVNSKGETK